MWVQGIKVRLLLLTLRNFLQPVNSFIFYGLHQLKKYHYSLLNCNSFYEMSFRNFFKESFLIDFILKSLLQRFIKIWVVKGFIILNLTFINSLITKFLRMFVLEQFLNAQIQFNSLSFNKLFISFFQLILLTVSSSGLFVFSLYFF